VDVAGKADGVTADPATGSVIATVNEDANSSLYTIDPTSSAAVQHYSYSEPLPTTGDRRDLGLLRPDLHQRVSAGTTGTNRPLSPPSRRLFGDARRRHLGRGGNATLL